MKHILTIDVQKCTGCRNCELACSVAHYRTFNPSQSRIKVIKNEKKGIILPMVCLQCEDPLCHGACPTGAIRPNSSGALYVEPDICIGCGRCVTACIYGGISMDPVLKKAAKCDLCDGDPACVKACEYGAIEYVEFSENALLSRKSGIKPVAKIQTVQEEV